MLNTAGVMDNAMNYTYFGARYYDSDLSVWLSVDPMSDEYPSMSPYMYVMGNPLKLIDPDGLAPSPPDDGPDKCSKWGGISFKGIGRWFKSLFWHKEVRKTKVITRSPQMIRSRWNRGTQKQFRIRGTVHTIR
jgi:RHS repeat-associated protein